jgi:hypothetical protein
VRERLYAVSGTWWITPKVPDAVVRGIPSMDARESIKVLIRP